MTQPMPPLPLDGQLYAIVDFDAPNDGNYDASCDGILTTFIGGATTCTSIIGPSGNPSSGAHHRPVLDIDLPVYVVPSSTPGHHHLYIDKPMTWAAYAKLLDALAEAGIIEPGYAEASIRRGRTDVRLPWVRK